jgi:hypothetical protein
MPTGLTGSDAHRRCGLPDGLACRGCNGGRQVRCLRVLVPAAAGTGLGLVRVRRPNRDGDAGGCRARPITLPSGASLAAFNGIDPNGTWRLWAYDDEPNGSPQAGGGINGGWALTITTANGVPAAKPDRFKVKAGKTLRVDAPGVLKNDRDPDDDALAAILVDGPKQGRVALKADGSFTYKSNKKAKGKDSFTYLAKDPSGLKAQATVHIQIKATKDNQNKKGKGGKNGKS